MFSTGRLSLSVEDIYKLTTDLDILHYYFGIKALPIVINSPLRKDLHPSFGFTVYKSKVFYRDFSTGEHGSLLGLLSLLWHKSFEDTLLKIYSDIPKFKNNSINNVKVFKHGSKDKLIDNNIELKCKIREWRDYDIEYWKSYGISIEWLKYADIYPISHKIVIKGGKKYIFNADKYAYAYVERKEGKVTLKIYQPYNKKGYKWSNRHDKSVISLWTKVPEYGDKICICSSMKDALCLSANTNIPAIAIQGEGYNMSDTAIKELKRRYKHIYILLDNDKAGIKDGIKLSKQTGFTNLVLPNIDNKKDISDLYKHLKDPIKFREILTGLFKD